MDCRITRWTVKAERAGAQMRRSQNAISHKADRLILSSLRPPSNTSHCSHLPSLSPPQLSELSEDRRWGGGAETNPPRLIKPSGLQAGSFLWKRFTWGGEFTKLCPRFCMLYTPNPLLYAAYFGLAFGSIVLASSKFCLCFFTLINWEGVLTTGHVWCVVPD